MQENFDCLVESAGLTVQLGQLVAGAIGKRSRIFLDTLNVCGLGLGQCLGLAVSFAHEEPALKPAVRPFFGLQKTIQSRHGLRYVLALGVAACRLPEQVVASFFFTPAMAEAKVSANIRLADSQKITALAVMSDGSIWSGEKSIVVTIAACIDGG